MSFLSIFRKLFDRHNFMEKKYDSYLRSTTIKVDPELDIYAEAYSYGSKHYPKGYTMHIDKTTSTITFNHN